MALWLPCHWPQEERAVSESFCCEPVSAWLEETKNCRRCLCCCGQWDSLTLVWPDPQGLSSCRQWGEPDWLQNLCGRGMRACSEEMLSLLPPKTQPWQGEQWPWWWAVLSAVPVAVIGAVWYWWCDSGSTAVASWGQGHRCFCVLVICPCILLSSKTGLKYPAYWLLKAFRPEIDPLSSSPRNHSSLAHSFLQLQSSSFIGIFWKPQSECIS